MTKETAIEWAKENAGKKFMLRLNHLPEQEAVVVGVYGRDGGVQLIAVYLTKGGGWTDPDMMHLHFVGDQRRFHSEDRTYQFVCKKDLVPIEHAEVTFAKKHVGRTCRFTAYGDPATGVIVGYGTTNDFVLVDRGPGNDGWAPRGRRDIVWLITDPKLDETRYWWTSLREISAVMDTIPTAPEKVEVVTYDAILEKVEKSAAFKPGDVVYLKSGGPAMTVDNDSDEDDDEYLCRWFPYQAASEVCEDHFAGAALTKTRPPEISCGLAKK